MTFYPPVIKLKKEPKRQLSGKNDVEENMTECLIRSSNSALDTGAAINLPIDYSKSMDLASVRSRLDYISSDPGLFYFLCLTGIIIPEIEETSSFTDRMYQLWVIILHIWVISVPLCYLTPLFWSEKTLSSTVNVAFLFIIVCVIFLQYILIISSVYYIRKVILCSISDPPAEFFSHYSIGIKHVVKVGYTLVTIFTTGAAVFLCFYASVNHSKLNDTAYTFRLIIMTIGSVIPAYPLVAAACLVAIDQRTSQSLVRSIKEEEIIHKQTLTPKLYASILQAIETRNEALPINLIMSTSIINTFAMVCIILILSQNGSSDDDSVPNHISNLHLSNSISIFIEILQILFFFGKETIILLVLLYEIAQVNELGEQLARTLAWQEDWGCIEGGQGDQPLKQHEQVQLVTMMMLAPLGCKIFAYRPSRFQLLVQMGSIIISVTVAIGSRLILS